MDFKSVLYIFMQGFLEKYGYLHEQDHTHSADKVTSAVR